MKKKKILGIIGILTLSFSSIAMASTITNDETNARKLDCHPGYIQVVDGGYTPPSYGSHSFRCNNTAAHGGSVTEWCDTVRVFSWAKYKCSKCGSTSTDDNTSTSHSAPHCPQR